MLLTCQTICSHISSFIFPARRSISAHTENVDRGQVPEDQIGRHWSNFHSLSLGLSPAWPCIRSVCWWPRGRWARSPTFACGTHTRYRQCPSWRTCTRTASPAWPSTSTDRCRPNPPFTQAVHISKGSSRSLYLTYTMGQDVNSLFQIIEKNTNQALFTIKRIVLLLQWAW